MKFYSAVMNLSNIMRFGTSHMVQPYNVAEHSYRVATMAMVMTDNYNKENPDDKISVEEVMRKALLHDLEEALMQDIASPVKKRGNMRDMLREVALDVLDKDVFDDSLSEKQKYIELWKKDKEEASGQVIEICDKLEALYACVNELNKGNRELKEAFHNLRGWFNSFEGKVLVKKFTLAQELLNQIDLAVSDMNLESNPKSSWYKKIS